MNNMESEFSRQNPFERANSLLKIKNDEYDKAFIRGDMDACIRIYGEMENLIKELRFANPAIELSAGDEMLKQISEQMTARHILKQGTKKPDEK